MNTLKKNTRHDNHKDEPPYSRVFVVCDKRLRETDLRPVFERFGTIENLFMPRNSNTGELNGIAFIKYTKTSSAANAIQEMHLKAINNESKPLKVMVASQKSDKSQNVSEDKYTRLFIKVSRGETELEIKQHFELFGKVESVFLQKDKLTDECKGFAYVKYDNFVDSAKAFEECDRKYKPVFAVPRDELKRSRHSCQTNNSQSPYQHKSEAALGHFKDDNNITSLISTNSQSYNSISVTCAPIVSQKHIEKLFNIVPGMTQCQYSIDNLNGICRAVITYQEEKAAAYAVEKLNQFEYPSGELVSVKPNENPLAKAASNLADIINTFKGGMDQFNPNLTMLAEAIAQASTLIKVAATNNVEKKEESTKYSCNIDLPPLAPMAASNSEVEKRLFIVCKPQPPPTSILTDVFCRFGHLIQIVTFPYKIYAFVKYASTQSALEAIRVVNGAMIDGAHFKVMEAIDKPTNDAFNLNVDSDIGSEDHDNDRKRMKLEEV